MTKKEARTAFDDVRHVDYKNIPLLRLVTNYYGGIKPARYTGLNKQQQQAAGEAIKKARRMGLLFYERHQKGS